MLFPSPCCQTDKQTQDVSLVLPGLKLGTMLSIKHFMRYLTSRNSLHYLRNNLQEQVTWTKKKTNKKNQNKPMDSNEEKGLYFYMIWELVRIRPLQPPKKGLARYNPPSSLL